MANTLLFQKRINMLKVCYVKSTYINMLLVPVLFQKLYFVTERNLTVLMFIIALKF